MTALALYHTECDERRAMADEADARNAEQAASYFAHIAKVIRSGKKPADYDLARAASYSAAALRVDPPADYDDLIAEADEEDAINAAAAADDEWSHRHALRLA